MIELQNITYTYSPKTPFEKTAVDGVSLRVNKGELVGIIGPSGSGKSTLIQLMNGLLKPASGEVFFEGEPLKKVNTRIGIVFQYPEAQIFEETIQKELEFGPKNIGMDKVDIAKAIQNSIKIMGIDSDLQKSPHEISGGQKRKVAIASVLSMNPEVLILDEPTAGLDPRAKRQLLETLVNMNRTGTTIILVSHSMEEIAEICTRIVVMKDAKIYADGPVADIFSNSKELIDIGLDIPEITKYMQERGHENIWTVTQAEEMLRAQQ